MQRKNIIMSMQHNGVMHTGQEEVAKVVDDYLLGNVACNFKKIPTLMQDLSRRCIAMRGGECVHVPS